MDRIGFAATLLILLNKCYEHWEQCSILLTYLTLETRTPRDATIAQCMPHGLPSMKGARRPTI